MNPYLFNPRIIDLKTPEYPNDIPGDFIRLHLMENPYSLPINVSEAIHHALNNTVLNRYPDSNHSNLKQKLRDTFSIPDNAEILTGNGSFELLQSVFLSMLNPDQCFLSLMPGFFFYQLSSHILGQRCINVKPRENLFDTIEKHQPSLIIIDNPNNPMGTILSCDYLEKALQAASGLVLIDEAYFHYGRVTMMPFLEKYENLIISRSLSKAGLAGLRLGYLCASPKITRQIKKVMLPFNVSAYTALAAEAALDYFSEIDQQVQTIIHDREKLLTAMKEELEDNALPSHTNFINFKIPNCDAETAFHQFIEQKILLFRYQTPPQHPLHNHLRVTVGTDIENQRFLEALIKIKNKQFA